MQLEEQIREKIARLPVTMPSSLPKQFVGTDLADEVLSLTLRRGGGYLSKCNRGKLPVEEKSIGDLIKDFTNCVQM